MPMKAICSKRYSNATIREKWMVPPSQHLKALMTLSDYIDCLIKAIAAEAAETSDNAAQRAFEDLAEHLRAMDMHDKYVEDAWREHGELPDEAQRKDALRTALAEYRSYDKAEQLSTVFLIDLVHAARPQEGFV
jgi:hypothetical protein